MESIDLERWDCEVNPRYRLTMDEIDVSHMRFWEFHHYLAQVVVAGLQRYRHDGHGYPGNMTDEEWDGILDEIMEGFGLYIAEPAFWFRDDPREAKWQRAKELLIENWEYLWD